MYGSISAKIAFGWTEAESVIACVASVSVWFRRKERGTRDKDRAKNGAWGEGVGKTFPSFPSPTPSFIFWLSFHFSRGQNRKSRSSVFLCFENYRKRMLRSLNPQKKNFADSKISGYVWTVPKNSIDRQHTERGQL